MRRVAFAIVALGFVAGGCSRVDSGQMSPVTDVNAAEPPQLVVYKSPTCGCCSLWVEHMSKAGFDAKVNDVDNMNPIKERVGVPYSMGSCHTAEVGGYFVEGHVPAEQVLRLLKEKPKAKGLTVPAMPIGSPGMEQGDLQQPYEVHLVLPDGTTRVYAKYPANR
jgi:hypothetical protein